MLSENAKPVGGNQSYSILCCASPKAIQFLSFPFLFFIPLAVGDGSYKYRLHCHIGICLLNVKPTLGAEHHGPKFSSTFKVTKNQAAEFVSCCKAASD